MTPVTGTFDALTDLLTDELSGALRELREIRTDRFCGLSGRTDQIGLLILVNVLKALLKFCFDCRPSL